MSTVGRAGVRPAGASPAAARTLGPRLQASTGPAGPGHAVPGAEPRPRVPADPGSPRAPTPAARADAALPARVEGGEGLPAARAEAPAADGTSGAGRRPCWDFRRPGREARPELPAVPEVRGVRVPGRGAASGRRLGVQRLPVCVECREVENGRAVTHGPVVIGGRRARRRQDR